MAEVRPPQRRWLGGGGRLGALFPPARMPSGGAKSRKHALKKKAEKAIATAKIAELQALRFLDGLLGAERDRQLTEANRLQQGGKPSDCT